MTQDSQSQDSQSQDSQRHDFKSTIFLPRTDFPMKAGLTENEPKILHRWLAMDFFARLREHRKDCKKFILHDGPPYANGHLHIGHGLNKILKDIINRFQSGLGRDANYVPGWDCHGLPIEWKIEEQYRKKGKDKDQVPIVEFRQECRDFAQHWMDIQRGEFQRLGVMGDWDNPYTTMKFESEAIIAKEIGRFLMNGSLYRGAKPVMWSAVEKTALAEAEIEYFDRQSVTIYARFPVAQTPHPALEGAVVICWTTTPWTMPGNRASAYGAGIEYGIWRVVQVEEGSLAQIGERLVLADNLAEAVAADCGITELQREESVPTTAFAETRLHHPLYHHGYTHLVPMLCADYVTTEQGTGIVHIAPGHGAEDYVLSVANSVPVPETVGADGRILEHLPLFAGLSALKDNAKIADILAAKGGLIGRGQITHSYPHSWRSHAPLIFRNTPQWFISMESHGLREVALKALGATAFYPPAGQTRLTGMIATRPDWCISRQRAWGVPIPVFFHKESGEPLRDQTVVDRIVEIFAIEGADAWFASPAERFLGGEYNADEYEQVTDSVDVWFDSGSTHAFLLEGNDDMAWPADMYLEGSDQHRGWFHSSLLESCGTRGRAPYDAVLTHGFVLDEKGRKMSKSLGNTITPQDVVAQHGADILRIWVANADYYNDLRIGPEILKQQADHYRRLRNTLRYILGSLDGFSEGEKIDLDDDMPLLEAWVLHRLFEVDKAIRSAIASHDYHLVFTTLHHFCNSDLSAFYFDIRKDTLYCDSAESLARRACRTVLDELFEYLVRWLAPILCYTAEEAWWTRYPDHSHSVHFEIWQKPPKAWENRGLETHMGHIRRVRQAVTGAIEQLRNRGEIGSSLEAHAIIYADDAVIKAFDGLDPADIFITSGAELAATPPPAHAITDADKTIGVVIDKAVGAKCNRCWKITPEVDATHPICHRCHTVVGAADG